MNRKNLKIKTDFGILKITIKDNYTAIEVDTELGGAILCIENNELENLYYKLKEYFNGQKM